MGKKTMASKIEWLDGGEVWNPLAGCSPVSPGCENCYSARLCATRLKHLPNFKGLAEMKDGAPRWTGEVRLLPRKLEQPLHWRKPRRIFVADKGDLFHERVPNEYIAAVFGVMAACPQHTFICLTKRPERMAEWYRRIAQHEHLPWVQCRVAMLRRVDPPRNSYTPATPQPWPLPNVWLGVTAEDQQRADERTPLLLQTPAAVRWVSVEPMLSGIDMDRPECCHCGRRDTIGLASDGATPWCVECDSEAGYGAWLGDPDNGINWVVCGCESLGARAGRPFKRGWAKALEMQCASAGVPMFAKQMPSISGGLVKSAWLADAGWPVQYPEPA